MNKKEWIATKEIIKQKHCSYCFSKDDLTVDHKIPKIKGGTDDFSNLQCLCKSCNQMKSSLTHGEVQVLFKWFMKIQIERINNGRGIRYFKHVPQFNKEDLQDISDIA